MPSVTVSLTGIPWASTARCSLLFSPFCADNGLTPTPGPGTVGMGFDIAGVDHQPFKVRVVNDRVQQLLPHSPVPPTAETALGVLPVSVVRGQVAPRGAGAQNPAHGVDKPPVVMGWSTSLALSPKQMWPQPLPNGIDHIMAPVCYCHSPPPSILFPISTNLPVNHRFDDTP